MKIAVCIKQVPDTTDVKINPQTNTIVRDGVRSVTNPFDLYAIELALALKDSRCAEVCAITMGPPQAKSSLEEALAMGADSAFLISSPDFAGSDTLATSYILSQAIKKLGGFDLIICGKQAQDGDTAQVGPGIAVRLGIPQITFVGKIVKISDSHIECERLTDYGKEIVRAPLPAVITATKEIGIPRLPSFAGKARAKKITIPVFGPLDLQCDTGKIGLDGSPTWVERIFPPEAKKGCFPSEANDETIKNIARQIAAAVWTSQA
jgi:electron transfer flavoprotein beta subunit